MAARALLRLKALFIHSAYCLAAPALDYRCRLSRAETGGSNMSVCGVMLPLPSPGRQQKHCLCSVPDNGAAVGRVTASHSLPDILRRTWTLLLAWNTCVLTFCLVTLVTA